MEFTGDPVERLAADAEERSELGDARPLDVVPAQHLVLHLDDVGRVEERPRPEPGIADIRSPPRQRTPVISRRANSAPGAPCTLHRVPLRLSAGSFNGHKNGGVTATMS